MDFADPSTSALSFAVLLLVAIAGALPAVLRVPRMRRLECVLGSLYWPFLTIWTRAIGERARIV